MTLIEQLVKLYFEEKWHTSRMSFDETYQYYCDMFTHDRVIAYTEAGKVLGVCEFARVNLEMLGYLMLSDAISPEIHDKNGKIIYVIGLYIPERYRRLGIIGHLKRELIARNPDAEFLTGETQGKHRKSWAVYQLKKEGILR